MSILIVSEPQDLHAQAVLRELARLGQEAHLLDFRDFPERMFLDMRLESGGKSAFNLCFQDGARIPMDSVRAAWWRRPQPFGLPVQGMEQMARHFALTETATAFQGMWQASRCLWVNDIVRDAAASHKVWQLDQASRIGLAIPDTRITSNPAVVRRFWEELHGEVVFKPFLQTFHSWRETRRLTGKELAALDSVRLAPVIFQRLVPGAADLRVTVIGSEVFSAAADLTKMEYQLDVRLNQQAYEQHRLPVEIQDKLLRLMRCLGLEYGAIDLRLTPEGEYVFFEVNPAGQFLFVEYACGLPITAALAKHLAAGKPSPYLPLPERAQEAEPRTGISLPTFGELPELAKV